MLIEKYTTLMGFPCALEFEVVVDSYGHPTALYETSAPEWYVDECYLDVFNSQLNTYSGPGMEVTGALLEHLTNKFHESLIEDFMTEAAEEYWTEKWTNA